MKFNLLAGVFAALLTTSTRAHPPGPETLQLKLSLDVVELAKDPTYAYLFFEGAELCPKNESYPVPVEVNCVPFKIGKLGSLTKLCAVLLKTSWRFSLSVFARSHLVFRPAFHDKLSEVSYR